MLGIDITDLCYLVNNRYIIKHLSCQIFKGDFVVVLGANGCGKSTFFNLLANSIFPSSGTINYLYSNFLPSTSLKLVTQNSADSLFMNLSVYDNYKVINHSLYKQSPKNKIEFASYISSFNLNLANKLELPVSLLSGGERQSLVLALMTCYQQLDVLLLDEPTSALDPITSRDIMNLTDQLVKKMNISCLISTHSLEIAQNYGNKILIMSANGNYTMINDSEEKKRLTVDYMKQHFYC